MPKTDGARVVADLRRLAEFGRYKTGVHRPTYSPDDVASRQWLADKFAEAGLDPVIDGIGNVIRPQPARFAALLVGSHSETQPHGGWLDGALGVIYALEAARAFAADPSLAGLGVEAVAWADEEGHYGNMLGSRSFTGTLGDDEIDQRHEPRRQELCATRSPKPGYAGRTRDRLDPQRYLGYFEAHIEQGGTLEATGQAHRHRRGDHRQLELLGHRHRRAEPCRHDRDAPPQGRRGRAGAPGRAHPRPLCRNRRGRPIAHGMDDRPHPDRPERAEHRPRPRRDAGAVPRHRHRHPGALRAGIARAGRRGRPRRAVRRRDRADLEKRAGADGRRVSATRSRARPSVTRRACTMRMPSGAGHDAQILARRMRSAMMFVPSIKRRQPSLVRGHERSGHRARRAGLRRRRGGDPARRGERYGVVIQESLRGLFYAPYYAALALGAYEKEGVEVRFVSAPDPGPGARRAVRRHGRCRLGRADAGQPDLRPARPIATSSASPRR